MKLLYVSKIQYSINQSLALLLLYNTWSFEPSIRWHVEPNDLR